MHACSRAAQVELWIAVVSDGILCGRLQATAAPMTNTEAIRTPGVAVGNKHPPVLQTAPQLGLVLLHSLRRREPR